MSSSQRVSVGCRASPLSMAQFREIATALPHLNLVPCPIDTRGDRDKKTSLRELDKTDFFTREIDAAQLSGECRLSVHSAKDLPEPLPEGLVLAALTRGVDPGDALVIRGELPPSPRVATSSKRREESVRQILSDARMVDIRGNIGERIAQLDAGTVDGIVMANAALIRLGIERPTLPLPGKTAPLQGQLAILTRENDWEMREALLSIDCRKTLYLGLDPCADPLAFPYPVIQIRRLAHISEVPGTHLLITSKVAARLLLEDIPAEQLRDKTVVAIGKATATALTKLGLPPDHVAQQENSEGVCVLLKTLKLERAHLFWPHSALSRPILTDFFQEAELPYTETPLYETLPFCPFTPPPLDRFETITFTSPSTVKGFLEIYRDLPQDAELRAIGPVTGRELWDRYAGNGSVSLR